MTTEFILIPGRSSRQGVTLNEGKYTDGYLDETSTLRMNPEDMQRIGIAHGDEVRMWNDVGEVVVPCINAKDECPEGIIFICYGDKSSQLMGGETHGSGMPDSKGLDVFVQPASLPRPKNPIVATLKNTTPQAQQPDSAMQAQPKEASVQHDRQDHDKPNNAVVVPALPAKRPSESQVGPTLVMGLFVLALITLAVVMYLGQ